MFTQEQIELLIKNNIIPKDTPPAQVDFFLKVCEKRKLDPFLNQIHLVERKVKNQFGNWEKRYTIQAGLDGMRAIAQRNVKIISYRRWVEKRDDDLYGCCEIETADRGKYYDELPFSEYKQTTSSGELTSFWKKFPQTMIKKCAEESVLRMLAPEDLSGVYGDDEMMQADEEIPKLQPKPAELKPAEQRDDLILEKIKTVTYDGLEALYKEIKVLPDNETYLALLSAKKVQLEKELTKKLKDGSIKETVEQVVDPEPVVENPVKKSVKKTKVKASSIPEKIKACNTVKELRDLWTTLPEKERTDSLKFFTDRKNEIEKGNE